MKMYIIVKNSIPDKLVPVITAHASLACYKKFQEDEQMIAWMNGVFKKVVCMVNEVDFENYKNEPDSILLTESSLDNREVCLAFCPRAEYPKKFKYLSMWTPQNS